MDKIEKLFKKISQGDRKRFIIIVEKIIKNDLKGLNIQKIKKTDFFRVRKGKFRIIFHKDSQTKKAIIDSIKLRREDTYKF